MKPHVTAWSEERVLDYFRWVSRDAETRIEALQQIAAVAIQRPSNWDMRAVRQAMAGVKLTITADACFGCLHRTRRLQWHHVIQVQHGGSSHPRNLVALCKGCHRRVHPWLPGPTSMDNLRSLTWIGDWVAEKAAVLEKVWGMAKREAARRANWNA